MIAPGGIGYGESCLLTHRVRRETVVDVLRESHPLVVGVRMVRHASGVLQTVLQSEKKTKQKKVYTRYVVHTLVSLRYGDSVVSLRHISLLCRFVSLMNRYVAFLTVPTASLPRENMFRRILILKLNNRPPTYSQLKNRTHTDHVQIDHLDPRLPF